MCQSGEVSQVYITLQSAVLYVHVYAPVAQLVDHGAVMQELVSSTPDGPTLRVLK